MHVLLVTALAALCASCALAGANMRVDPATQHFVDGDGRSRIFHGVNAVVKTPPFHPKLDAFDATYSLSDEDVELLQQWGVTVVRCVAAIPALGVIVRPSVATGLCIRVGASLCCQSLLGRGVCVWETGVLHRSAA